MRNCHLSDAGRMPCGNYQLSKGAMVPTEAIKLIPRPPAGSQQQKFEAMVQAQRGWGFGMLALLEDGSGYVNPEVQELWAEFAPEWYVGQTVWCTTHALTKGIASTHIAKIAGGGFAKLQHKPHGIFKLGLEVHATEQAAKERAAWMRQNRLRLVRKQLEKLEALKF